MKINYQKSEVFGIGITDEELEGAANIFNCDFVVWPMKYLGLPINKSKPKKKNFEEMVCKIEKKLASWQNSQLSYGGRMVMINSCLSSIPLYTMGVFALPESVCKKIDSIRSQFFWEGIGKKKKYHMISWQALSAPKQMGGMGFMDVRAMNQALLGKWIYNIERGQEGTCYTVMRNKYNLSKGVLQADMNKGSYFWKGLNKSKMWVRLGCGFEVGAGTKTSFWHDVWDGDTPLKTRFRELFEGCRNNNLAIAETVKMVQENTLFRRSLRVGDLDNWKDLSAIIRRLEGGDGSDQIIWLINKKGFSSKSIYDMIVFRGVIDVDSMIIWKCGLPMKVKVFTWLMLKDRIQVGDQLRRMNWRGDPHCKLCGLDETVDHLIFECGLARMLWVFVVENLEWPLHALNRRSFMEMMGNLRDNRKKLISIQVLGAIACTLWLTRNEHIFRNKICTNAFQVVHKLIAFLTQWLQLVPARLKEETSRCFDLLRARLRQLVQQDVHPASDVTS
ncbi:hypothetical protein GUJ93_ZPchr0002g26060 [Zizania palustris]|uniref:Reverse transcriptase zinc-binding domain-containing protein n=1 Tax=Zizania palustris TaxID=103762 RepID=A0A8J5VSX0_ZIZPA|nr:hypothetical protein GUJ93_ZPchr0002g26060 [Zizania palustris]